MIEPGYENDPMLKRFYEMEHHDYLFRAYLK